MEEEILIRELATPLFQAKGWMKLIGVVSIIGGILTALTIFGIIFCWIPIWLGIVLFKAGSLIELAQSTGNKEHFSQSMFKLKTYFSIAGILLLIYLILIGIGLAVSGGTIFGILNTFD